MAANDYILCDKCGVKIIYDGKDPNREDGLYTNRDWWKARYGTELTLVCPNCREKEEKK